MSLVIRFALCQCLSLCTLTAGSFLSPPQEDRLLDWSNGPAAENVQMIAPGLNRPYEHSSLKALELVAVVAAGKPVRLGQKFVAGDDWVGGLVFRLKNVSQKAIHSVRLGLVLPETQAGESRLAFHLEYGRHRRPEEVTVFPDQVFEVKFREYQYQNGLEPFAAKGSVPRITRALIGNVEVSWEDGSLWLAGRLPVSN